jgi:hypothetical protein
MGLSTKGHIDKIRLIKGGAETLCGILSLILNGQYAGKHLKCG